MNRLRRIKWFSLSCPVVHIVCLEFCRVWVLSFVLDDASEEDFAKTGPLRPKQELEQRSSSDLPRGLSPREEGRTSGLGEEPSGITLPLVGPPSYPIVLMSAFNPLVTF